MGWHVCQPAHQKGPQVLEENHMTGDEQATQAWLNELQIAVDTLREDKKGLLTRMNELEETIAMYKSMVERLRLALSQGRDYYL